VEKYRLTVKERSGIENYIASMMYKISYEEYLEHTIDLIISAKLRTRVGTNVCY